MKNLTSRALAVLVLFVLAMLSFILAACLEFSLNSYFSNLADYSGVVFTAGVMLTFLGLGVATSEDE